MSKLMGKKMIKIEFLKKRLWKYRGIRITPKMEHGVLRTGLSIFIPVFLVSLFFCYRNGINKLFLCI